MALSFAAASASSGGDTIVVKVGADEHKIRLSGVDAPEIAQAFGRESRASLAGLVEGEAVFGSSRQCRRGSFGRESDEY